MRVQVWFRAVVAVSGKTAYALEKEFASVERRNEFRVSSTWAKYASGKASPSHPASGLGLVERVDAIYPGTSRWYHHPLWRALDPEPITHLELRWLYEGLPDGIRTTLLFAHPGNRFWRRPIRHQDFHKITAEGYSIDSAAAFACLTREAEVAQDQQLHRFALDALNRQILAFENHDLMSVVLPSMQKLVAEHWEGTIYWEGSRMKSIHYDFVRRHWV